MEQDFKIEALPVKSSFYPDSIEFRLTKQLPCGCEAAYVCWNSKGMLDDFHKKNALKALQKEISSHKHAI